MILLRCRTGNYEIGKINLYKKKPPTKGAVAFVTRDLAGLAFAHKDYIKVYIELMLCQVVINAIAQIKCNASV